MSFTKIFSIISLLNFFIAACLGLLMRYAFVWEATWMKYKNIMYAHSHMALLGWVYLVFSVLLLNVFAPKNNLKNFTVLFSLIEINILGLGISLAVGGFNPISILLLIIFILLSYFLFYKLWYKRRAKPEDDRMLFRTSIVWFILSTLSLFMMFFILYTGKVVHLYYIVIQFFLHFQMNGWLLFAALALFFNQLKVLDIDYSPKLFKWFYYLLLASTVLTFALAVSWANKNAFIFGMNSLGVLIQLLALVVFFKLINKDLLRKFKSTLKAFPKWMYIFAFVSFICKVAIQTVVFFPKIAVVSYTIRLYVLGFIHLVTLGMFTTFTLGYSFSAGYISYQNPLSKIGWILVLVAFLSTELFLFGQGTLVWVGYGFMSKYHEAIFVSSLLFPIGILLAFIGQLTNVNNVQPN